MSDLQLERAMLSLEGLSLGDAFGQRFFFAWVLENATEENLPQGPWTFTDDTEMAIGLIQHLKAKRTVVQDELVRIFAERYIADPGRGYGEGAAKLLTSVYDGQDWRTVARSLFRGTGSYGNGAAMRIAPLGAWFADDVNRCVHEARLSAEVTHSHIEGIEGAVAVALAACWIVQHPHSHPQHLMPWVCEQLKESRVKSLLQEAAAVPLDEWEFDVARQLGSGDDVSAMDTVPFCLWVTAAHLTDYREAMWTAARVGGDVDTTCAIIGGLVALSVGRSGIPEHWRIEREPLPFGW